MPMQDRNDPRRDADFIYEDQAIPAPARPVRQRHRKMTLDDIQTGRQFWHLDKGSEPVKSRLAAEERETAACIDTEAPARRHDRQPGLFRDQETPARRFYRQAVKYADREDEFSYSGQFHHYFPTYSDMTTAQLRGYLTFRTHARRGDFLPVSLSFIYVYVYELLMNVGTASPQEGYAALQALRKAYPDRALGGHLERWLQDYVLYYRLGQPFIDEAFGDVIVGDQNRLALSENGEDEQIFQALCRISTYKAQKSPFYKKFPGRFIHTQARVYRKMRDYFLKWQGRDIAYYLAGARGKYPCLLFSDAVFYDYMGKREDYSCQVDEARTYSYVDGHWYVDSFGQHPMKTRSRFLGQIMQETDRQLREAFGYGRQLGQKLEDQPFIQLIAEAVAEEKKLEEEAAKPKLTIDRSALAGIRANSDITMGQLLEGTEEEAEAEEQEPAAQVFPESKEVYPAAGPAVTDPAPAGPREAPAFMVPEPLRQEAEESDPLPFGGGDGDAPAFTQEETGFLQLLLQGGDAEAFARSRHTFASVLADDVNEKALDWLGDMLVEEDETGRYRIVEDYLDDIRSLEDI